MNLTFPTALLPKDAIFVPGVEINNLIEMMMMFFVCRQ